MNNTQGLALFIVLSVILAISLFVLKLFCTQIPPIKENTKYPCQHHAVADPWFIIGTSSETIY